MPGRKSLNVSSSSVLALGCDTEGGRETNSPTLELEPQTFSSPAIAPRRPLPLHTRRGGGGGGFFVFT